MQNVKFVNFSIFYNQKCVNLTINKMKCVYYNSIGNTCIMKFVNFSISNNTKCVNLTINHIKCVNLIIININ